jgi:hypothetical protein
MLTSGINFIILTKLKYRIHNLFCILFNLETTAGKSSKLFIKIVHYGFKKCYQTRKFACASSRIQEYTV